MKIKLKRGRPYRNLMFVKDNNNCFNCTSGNYLKDGYPIICFNHKKINLHRFMWQNYNGEIPKELCVLHKCDNRKCSNIDHLFLGTLADNCRDRSKKGRTKNGGLKGEQISWAKLNNISILKIRNDNRLHKIIAKDYNVSPNTISTIKRGETWRHLLPLNQSFRSEVISLAGKLWINCRGIGAQPCHF
jgi:hypothetical protein